LFFLYSNYQEKLNIARKQLIIVKNVALHAGKLIVFHPYCFICVTLQKNCFIDFTDRASATLNKSKEGKRK